MLQNMSSELGNNPLEVIRLVLNSKINRSELPKEFSGIYDCVSVSFYNGINLDIEIIFSDELTFLHYVLFSGSSAYWVIRESDDRPPKYYHSVENAFEYMTSEQKVFYLKNIDVFTTVVW